MMTRLENPRRLFSVQCRHGYFAHGICMPLALHPTSACQQLLKEYQLTFRPEPGGGNVHDLAGGSRDWQALAKEERPFSFTLQCHDPSLLNYTHAPMESAAEPTQAQLFYFDNLLAREPLEGRIHLLAEGDTLAQYALPYPPAGDAEALPLPRQDWNAQLTDDIHQAVRNHRAASLKPWRPLGGSQGLWGVISLFPQRLSLPEPGQPFEPGCYSLDLAPRHTRWRYYIVQAPRQDKPVQFEIIAQQADQQGKDMIFLRQTGDTRLGGRPAQVFVAPQPLPLLQAPGDAIQVQLRSPSGKPQVLPHPQAHRLTHGPDGHLYSEVFVHL